MFVQHNIRSERDEEADLQIRLLYSNLSLSFLTGRANGVIQWLKISAINLLSHSESY